MALQEVAAWWSCTQACTLISDHLRESLRLNSGSSEAGRASILAEYEFVELPRYRDGIRVPMSQDEDSAGSTG